MLFRSQGFIDALLDSEEYLSNFGYNTVPYQRRRNLPGRELGEVPFNIKSPRYDGYYRSILGFPQIIWQNAVRRFTPQETKVQAGNPAGFLGMARSIKPQQNVDPTRSVSGLDYLSKVPYRRR